ncbi:MAG: hypothetical protein NTX03_08775 [Bacteroidetes bacterium]|nr:hypothetical protein [Bacteroidota bacterium]
MIKTIPLENGCIYHIYNRGNNREDIFPELINYEYFLKLWVKHIMPIADTYAYCLLKNHFHAMIRIKEDLPETDENKTGRMNNAEQHFSNFFNAYAKAFNKKYNRTGKLFEERFKRKKIESDIYYTQLIYYIHANPQKHGFIDDFKLYPHSSYQSILSLGKTNLKRDEVIEWFGGRDNFIQFHNEKHIEYRP